MIVGRIISTFLLATIMMMVVGVFGGFNVHQPELGAPFAARGQRGGRLLCALEKGENNHQGQNVETLLIGLLSQFG